MLDMTFQLLAFFIMTYHPSDLTEGAVEFNLPAAGQAKAKDQEPDPNTISEKDIALPAQITIELDTSSGDNNEGAITAIRVVDTNGPVGVENLTVLGKHLKTRHDELAKKDAKDDNTEIKIVANSKLKYANIMQVVDICLNVGKFAKVSFGPPPDLASSGG
jgi:biopolymer transport protein ExbD